ncbi:FAD-dependent oxidoreductase [Solwaraspora sp. WMMD1047]|uniref:FAD-dependent oxidoreductase n=1 Tax=Solwaraspora sp. WMMD1047 TaxID=3016102 RepID=UPI00241718DF|nr:FAD-dependent oxidoreductase [Solwaraspora sp. WMMD1047]MDG4834340.1 FAD-dependent oxidoreductase [Solwaraspora sp. WMMD1047]
MRRVAVFGAGLAGLTAAVTAAEAGAEVTVFEKSAVVGGALLLSGGLIWSVADLDAAQAAAPEGNPLLQQLVVERLAADRSWLAGLGVRFTTPAASPELAHGGWSAVTGEPGIEGLGQQVEPSQAVDALRRRLDELGGTLRLECGLDSLRTAKGRVVGARVATAAGELFDLDADVVVLATGGFQGNPELLDRYVAPAAHLYLRTHGWSTGDGLLAATAAGAAVSGGMDTFYGHAMIAPPGRFRPRDFGEVTQGYGQGAVALDLTGRRFTDESAGTGEEQLCQRLARRPEGRGFYLLDQGIAGLARTPGKAVTGVVLDRARSYGGSVLVADSIAALTDALAAVGVPAAATRQTLAEYDRLCAGQPAAPGSPGRSRFRFPLRQPPFYAVAVKASITMTLGGLLVDDELRVLRRAASSSPIAQSVTELADIRQVPIGGLLAAGADVGDISRGGYLGGLATALTTGRVAGLGCAG